MLYLLEAPAARGLFQRAIAESGWPRTRVPSLQRTLPPKSSATAAETEGAAFAKAHGIDPTQAGAAAALRALPVSTLQQDYAQGADFMIDGVVIPRPLVEAFAKGQVARVPLMIGGNSWEANLVDFERVSAESILQRTGDRARALALYDPTGELGLRRAAEELFGDIEVTEPNRRFAELHNSHGARAFVYRFDYVPAAVRGKQPGTPHAAEIGYVFGTLPTQNFTTLMGNEVPAASPEDWAMSDKVIAYWTAFARTGDPGAAAGPRWPAYDRDNDRLLEFTPAGLFVRERYHAERLNWLQSIAESQN